MVDFLNLGFNKTCAASMVWMRRPRQPGFLSRIRMQSRLRSAGVHLRSRVQKLCHGNVKERPKQTMVPDPWRVVSTWSDASQLKLLRRLFQQEGSKTRSISCHLATCSSHLCWEKISFTWQLEIPSAPSLAFSPASEGDISTCVQRHLRSMNVTNCEP